MNIAKENLDLIDLIARKHLLLRKTLDRKWAERSDQKITSSEWFVMDRVYKQQPTISSIAKQVDISRQAVHKTVKSLRNKGLAEVANSDNNKDKCLKLTEAGEKYYEQAISLKQEIVNKIAVNIGNENIELLTGLLKIDWEL